MDPHIPCAHRAHLVSPGGSVQRLVARCGLAHGADLGVDPSGCPPIGGVDVTPVIWVGLLSLLRELLVGQQGLLSLVLLRAQSIA